MGAGWEGGGFFDEVVVPVAADEEDASGLGGGHPTDGSRVFVATRFYPAKRTSQSLFFAAKVGENGVAVG
ncbi:MAG: hypothetical protein ABL959_12960 [Pyrinomonadaceae bacterium]